MKIRHRFSPLGGAQSFNCQNQCDQNELLNFKFVPLNGVKIAQIKAGSTNYKFWTPWILDWPPSGLDLGSKN